MDVSLDFLLIIGLSLVALGLFVVMLRAAGRPPFPRGPEGSFIVGNAFQMPKVRQWITFAEWGKIYGDVVYTSMFGKSMIILNSQKAAADLLEKKSSNYSSEPVTTMMRLSGTVNGVAAQPYNDRMRKFGRILHKALNRDVVLKDYASTISEEVQKLLQRLLESPDNFDVLVGRTTASVIMKVVYGYEVQGDDDKFVNLAKDHMRALMPVIRPGAWLVDSLPILRFVPGWFPGTQFKKVAEKLKREQLNMVQTPYDWAKKSIASGTATTTSFTSRLLEDGDEEDIIMWAAGSLFNAATHTTTVAITTFVLAMVLYPDVQSRAQKEIDNMIGRERLPAFADQSSLPFVDAVIKEVLRWNPPSPIGGRRLSTENDVYEGRFIPKSSVILTNIWAMANDDRVYSNPKEFNPDRFLPSGGDLAEQDPRDFVFGFGQRACPGLHLAYEELYIAIVQILTVFKLLKQVDEKGNKIEVKAEFDVGGFSQPNKFQCRFEPRFPGAEVLLTS